MVKSELIERLMANPRCGELAPKDVEIAVNCIIDCVAEKLSQGERVELRGFGSFDVRFRGCRDAHNPRTGSHVRTEPKYVPHFKPGKELRIRVDKGNVAKAKTTKSKTSTRKMTTPAQPAVVEEVA